MVEGVSVRGARLALQSEGSGPHFLWAHGLSSSRAQEDESGLFDWSSLAGALRLVRYDARGHGHSEATTDPDDYRWDALAGDMLAVADALGVASFVAGGASMGAATALHAAVAEPARVEALVVVIPPTAWETRAAQGDLYRAGADLVERHGRQALLDASAQAPAPAIFAGHPELTRFDPDIEESAMPTVLRGAARSDLPPPEALRTLTQPALVLAWETDPAHPVSTAEALGNLLPGAEVQVAGTFEEVQAWPQAVRAFVTGLPVERP